MLVAPLGLLVAGAVSGSLAYIAGFGLLVLSHGRYFARRYGPKRTKRILRRSLVMLGGLMAILTAAGLLMDVKPLWALSAAGGLWLALALFALINTLKRTLFNRYRRTKALRTDLPTVTLAIPARNETLVLTDCLRSAVASDYEKLEILVLDDCSRDSTPQIIKSFAHDGVRFISGQVPASGWIGKNQAYQTLLEQASGDIVIFAGVDIRWQTDSISKVVNEFARSDNIMMSIMPFRSRFDLGPTLSRPLRYFWQLSLSRLPVMNSVWAVRRAWLVKAGGFKPVRHAILPEKVLAASAKRESSYKFIISSPELGITTRKTSASQLETATRTLYPQTGKDPIIASLATWMLLLAALTLVTGWWGPPVFVIGNSAVFLSFMLSEITLQPRGWPLSSLTLPLSVLSQGLLTIASMTGYEFGRIEWKGRNVCLPVMNQIDRGGASPEESPRLV